MINIKEDQNNLGKRHKSQFASDFLNEIKNIETDADKLVEIARRVELVDKENKIGGVTGEPVALRDKDDNVKMFVKVSNAKNIAPQIKDKIVGKLTVISVGTVGNNIMEVVKLLKDLNESNGDGIIE